MIQVTNLIGNMEPVGDEPRMPVIDPATAEEIGSVPEGDARDVDRAVAVALDAFPTWSGASSHGGSSPMRSARITVSSTTSVRRV